MAPKTHIWLFHPYLAINYSHVPVEMRRSAVLGGSDVHGMERALDEGFWNSPLLDPETFVDSLVFRAHILTTLQVQNCQSLSLDRSLGIRSVET